MMDLSDCRCAVHAVTIIANSFDPDDDLSTAFGPETLAERDMMPEGFDNTPRPSPSVSISIRCYNMINFAPTTSNLFALAVKLALNFLRYGPAIAIKPGPVVIDVVLETSKVIRMASRDCLADLFLWRIIKPFSSVLLTRCSPTAHPPAHFYSPPLTLAHLLLPERSLSLNIILSPPLPSVNIRQWDSS
jgi:hypothetical protein